MFRNPKPLEYPEFYRPGMGTENIGQFLRSMVQLLRPNRILEIGAGYTTPFLLEALVNNQNVLDDSTLDEDYFTDYIYDPRLIIIDDMSLGDLKQKPGMPHILKSKYVEFIEGRFQGKGKKILNDFGMLDFVWFDCGGTEEYKDFIHEYWDLCSGYLFFHSTYTRDKQPNKNLKVLIEGMTGQPFRIDIIEPHKKRQGSVTVVNKQQL